MSTPDYIKIAAENIRALRGDRKVADLAEAIGVKRQQWQRWESGKGNPQLKSLVAIAKLFGVEPSFLITDNLHDARVYGRRLRRQRESRRMSHEDLSQETGIRVERLRQMEAGDCRPTNMEIDELWQSIEFTMPKLPAPTFDASRGANVADTIVDDERSDFPEAPKGSGPTRPPSPKGGPA